MRVQSAISAAVMSVTHTITVAAGPFAPGHLGELTRVVPFELVDCLVDEARVREKRVRDLPSRAGVYFLLAMCLFPRAGCPAVWGKLTAGLGGLALPSPSGKGLRDLRRRIGAAPLKGPVRDAGRAAGPPGHARDHGRRVPDRVLRRLQDGQGARHAREPGLAGQDEREPRRDRLPGHPAHGPGRDRDPGPARGRVRQRRHRGAGLGPAAAAPAGQDDAGPDGPGLRQRGLPRRGRRDRRPVPGPPEREPPAPGAAPPARRVPSPP